MPQVFYLNGNKAGEVEKTSEVKQWLNGFKILRPPTPVRVEQCNHLGARNGCSFMQIGKGTFKLTGTLFAVIKFKGAKNHTEIVLVPQQFVKDS